MESPFYDVGLARKYVYVHGGGECDDPVGPVLACVQRGEGTLVDCTQSEINIIIKLSIILFEICNNSTLSEYALYHMTGPTREYQVNVTDGPLFLTRYCLVFAYIFMFDVNI